MSYENHLTYALDKTTKKIASVESVAWWLQCNCICPECGGVLMKKWGREFSKKRAHFAHYRSTENCNEIRAYESTLHKLWKQILQEKKELFLPPYTEYEDIEKIPISSKKQSFDSILIEERADDLIPDVIGIIGDKKIWIELANTHFVDTLNYQKLRKIRERDIECIEIDLRWQSLDTLEDFLLNSDINRYWINSPSNKLFAEQEWERRRQEEEAEMKRKQEREKQKSIQLENKIKRWKEEWCIKFKFSRCYEHPYDCPKIQHELNQLRKQSSYSHPIIHSILNQSIAPHIKIYYWRKGAYTYLQKKEYSIYGNVNENNPSQLYAWLKRIEEIQGQSCSYCKFNKLNIFWSEEWIDDWDENISICSYKWENNIKKL